MTWEYEYEEAADETTLYWGDEEQATIDRKISSWKNGFPTTDEAREAVAGVIQDAGTPERIRMQYDFNYGFEARDSEQS